MIEGGYENIVDELWYIYAGEEVRRRRLKHFRNYSDEKISGILERQLSEEEFRKHCKVVIDNGGSLADTYEQIDKKLEDICDRGKNYSGQLVFGLDIGTRSVVGTVGYRSNDRFMRWHRE